MEPNQLKPVIPGPTMSKGGVLVSLALLGAACANESATTSPATNIPDGATQTTTVKLK